MNQLTATLTTVKAATSISINSTPYIVYVEYDGANSALTIYDISSSTVACTLTITATGGVITSMISIESINSPCSITSATTKIYGGSPTNQLFYTPSTDSLHWSEGTQFIYTLALNPIGIVASQTVTGVSIKMVGLWKQKTQWFIIQSSPNQVALLNPALGTVASQALASQPTSISFIQGQGNVLVQVAKNTNFDIQEYIISATKKVVSESGEDISTNTNMITNYNPKTKIIVISSANPQNLKYYVLNNQCSKKCVGCLSPNYCTTCDSNKNRIYGKGSYCPCRPGFIEDELEDCQKCSDANCLVCGSVFANSCLQCSSGFQLSALNTCECSSGYYLDGSSCIKCNFNCSTCSNSSSCTTCTSTNVLINTATATCPCVDGYYADFSGQICSKCHTSCKTCTGPYNYQCVNCQDASLGYDGLDAVTGLCKCKDGFYRTSEGTCNLCSSPCQKCVSASTKCISCDPVTNRYLTSSFQCMCSSGYIEDSSSVNCKQCTGQKCQECLSTDVSKCTKCPILQGVQLVLISDKCECPDGYYDNGTTCTKCHYTCKKCTGQTESNCLSCNYSLSLAGSKCECPINQYFADFQCKNCSPICNGGCVYDQYLCQGCITNSSMIGNAPGRCECKEQYFFDGTVCQSCTGPCSKCSNATTCTECMPNAKLVGNTCTCIDGYYLDGSGKKCNACPANCITCSDASTCIDNKCHATCKTCSGLLDTNCLSCYSEQNRKLNGTKCDCESNYYGIQNNTCLLCHSSCLTCTGPFGNECTACKDSGISLSPNGYCSQCKDGFFMKNNNCQPCNTGCLKCEGESTNCIKCSGQLVLQSDNTCQCNLDHRLKAATNDQCEQNPCISTSKCLTCLNDLTTCLTCDLGLNRHLIGSQCLCKPGYAQDTGTGTCVACHYSCLTCSSTDPTKCTSCNPESYRVLVSDACTCLDGYYDDTVNQNCKKCRYNCSKCTNGTSCTDCISTDRTLANDCRCTTVNFSDYGQLHTCVKCPSGYFSEATDTSICKPCDKNCSECQGTSTNCISCSTISQRTLDGANICQCQNPQYPLDVDGIKCQECPYYCPSNCQIEASTPADKKYTSVCKSCDASKNRIQNPSDQYECICADGFYSYPGEFDCRSCHYSCKACIGPGIDQCTACPADRDQVNSLTTTTIMCKCKTQYFNNPTTKACEQCDLSCAECSSKHTCLSCTHNIMILKNGICSCPTGYYLSAGTGLGGLNECLKCNYTCGSCLDNNLDTNCLSCAHYTRTFQYNIGTNKTGKCVCASNLFEGQAPNQNQCVQCHYSCLTCQGGSGDDKCLTCDDQMNRVFDGAGKCNCKPQFQAVAGVALCTNCHFSCSGCSGPNSDMCSSCDAVTRKQITTVNGFTCECNDGYYEANQPLCSKCHYSCSKCDGANDYNCKECPAGSFRLTNQLPLCPCQDYYYDDGKNANCQPCSHRCAQCSQSNNTICLKCLSSDFRVFDELKQDCACIKGYYDAGVNQCAICDPQCVSCEDTTGNCLTCNSYKFRTLNNATHKCVCKAGYFSADLTNLALCTKCASKCSTCDNQTGFCLTCSSLNRDTNIASGANTCDCLPGYIEIGGECKKCDYTCPSECLGPLRTQCDNKCQSVGNLTPLFRTYNAATGTCDCIVGYSEDINNPSSSACMQCSPYCSTCLQKLNKYACLSCYTINNRYLSSSQCICMPGYFEDSTTKNCIKCTDPCKECSGVGTNKCTDCSDTNNRTLNTITHQCDCKKGYFDDGGVCRQCHFSCSTCSGGSTASDCMTCDSNKGRYKVNNSSIIPGICSCKDGYFDDNTNELCLSCDWSCNTCSGIGKDCQTCDATREILPVLNTGGMFDNICECKATYYSVYPNKQCFQCHYSCQYCSGNGEYDCKSCDNSQQRIQGAFNNNGITFQCVCQTGYYDIAGNGSCSSCPYHCKTCTRDQYNQQCLTCDPLTNRQLDVFSGRCKCKSGYFEDEALHQQNCQSCHTSCAECSKGTYQDCTKCNSLDNRFFQNGECVCQQGYYNVNSSTSQCQSCYYSCKTCSDSNGNLNNSCLSCDADKFRVQNGGYCDCKPGYMDVPPNPVCQKCHFSCDTCDYTLSLATNQCKTCNPLNNRVAVGNNCPCLDGYYEISGNPICQPCHPSCRTCNGSSESQCLTCEAVNNRIQDGSKCPCAIGFYQIDNLNKKCDSCHYKCQNCNGPNYNQCTSCDSSLKRVLINNECRCQPNLFDIIDIKLCSSCHYSCLECTSNTAISCTSCPIGSHRSLTNNQCICDDGYFDVNLNQVCQQCHFSCKTCNPLTPTQCLSCSAKNNRQQSGNLCPCKKGYFEDNQASCVQCDITCMECDGPGPSSCTACNANEFRQLMPDKTCRCLSGYYFHRASQKCLACDSNCKECYDDATRCISCDSSQILQPITNKCVCADRYYNNSSVCSKCHESCLQCTGPSLNQCSACKASDNRVQVGNLCKCIEGFYDIIGKSQCSPCHFSCSTCNGPDFNNCLGCNSATYYRQQNGNKCECNPGYYDAGTQKCQKCHYSCKTCDQKGEFDCLDCPVSVHREYVATKKQCRCSDGFYNDTTQQKCLPCHTSCLTCSGPDASNCLTCSLALHNRIHNDASGLCLCTSGTFNVPNQPRCSPCHYSCSECSQSSSSTACTKCSDSNYRTYNSSFNRCDCNDGYYDDSHSPQCALCHFSCKKCFKGDATSCTECNQVDFFRKFNSNTQTCDCLPGYYSEMGVQKCQPCHFTCLTCNGPSENNCQSCLLEAKRYMTNQNICACQVGYYEVASPNNQAVRICSPCRETCFSCSSYSTCTGCKSSDNRAINSVTKTCDCKDGFYEVRTGNTVLPACQQCSTADNKIVAQDKLSCICKPGYYINSSGKCNQCPISCSECDSFSNCTACDGANNRELKVGACIPMIGFFESGLQIASKCDQVCKNCEIAASNCTSCRTEDGYIMTDDKKSCKCKDNYSEIEDLDTGIKVCRSPQALAQQSENDNNVMWFYIFLSISAILAMIIIIYIARKTCFKSSQQDPRVHILDQTNQDIFNQRDESNAIVEESQNASRLQQPQQGDDFGLVPQKKKNISLNPPKDKIKEENL